jgi:hypothetical protein
MAPPTKTDLETMDYAFQGQPFVNVPARSDIDTTTMDWAFQGQPFVTNPFGGTPPPTNTTNFFHFI